MVLAMVDGHAPGSHEELEWIGALRAFIAERRREAAAPRKADLDRLGRVRLSVAGGFVSGWLRARELRVLEQRAAALGRPVAPPPLVVFRGDDVLVVACRLLLGRRAIEGAGRRIALLDREWEEFARRWPESRPHLHHVAVRSRLDAATGPELDALARTGGSVEGRGTYLVHRTEIHWAPGCAFPRASLWLWRDAGLHLVADALGPAGG